MRWTKTLKLMLWGLQGLQSFRLQQGLARPCLAVPALPTTPASLALLGRQQAPFLNHVKLSVLQLHKPHGRLAC